MENKNSISLFDIAIIGLLFFTSIGWVCLAFYVIFVLLNPIYWVYRIFKHMNIVEENIRNNQSYNKSN